MAHLLTYDDLPAEVQEKLDAAYDALGRRRYREAIPGLATAVDAFPAYIHGVYALGRALRAVGDRDHANERFVAATAIAPDDPRICLGLAWKLLDEDDFDGAGELAARALPRADTSIRGDLLAVLGLAAEADDRDEDAARLFLDAYEAGTMLDWLEAHCRLAGIDYLVETHDGAVPWPITAVERRWMYSAIDAALIDAAYEKNPAVKDGRVLVTGCDGTARLTAAWAERAGVSRARLYQALADRGGFCDCEVLMNAADKDGHDGFALVAGAIDGEVDDVLADLERSFHDEEPSGPPRLDPDAEDPDVYLGIYLDTARIPLQVTDSGTIGKVLHAMADRPPDRARLRLLIGFIGEAPAVVLAGPGGEKLRSHELDDGPLPADLEREWPGLATLVEQLRAGLPPRGN